MPIDFHSSTRIGVTVKPIIYGQARWDDLSKVGAPKLQSKCFASLQCSRPRHSATD